MSFKQYIITITLVVIQLTLEMYFDMAGWLYFNILPIIILSLSCRRTTVWLMLFAFFLGFGADLLGNGTLGLNASILVFLALIRRNILKLVLRPNVLERVFNPSISSFGFSSYSIYILISYIIFFLSYIFMEGGAVFSWGTPISILVNTFIAYFLGLLYVDHGKPIK